VGDVILTARLRMDTRGPLTTFIGRVTSPPNFAIKTDGRLAPVKPRVQCGGSRPPGPWVAASFCGGDKGGIGKKKKSAGAKEQKKKKKKNKKKKKKKNN